MYVVCAPLHCFSHCTHSQHCSVGCAALRCGGLGWLCFLRNIRSAAAGCEIRVITFDLDNTLWKTGATISAANDELATFVNEKLISDLGGNGSRTTSAATAAATATVRVEKIMGTLYQNSKATYSPIEMEEAKSPVLLTQLRKDAIRHVFKEHSGINYDDDNDTNNDNARGLEALVEEAFAVWVNARYQNIPSHFAESVITCLQDIRSLKTSENRNVLVGAITDGNSDPTMIPELAEFFDFCINAESVGIGKPDKSVYLRGVARALQHPSLQDIVPLETTTTSAAAAVRNNDDGSPTRRWKIWWDRGGSTLATILSKTAWPPRISACAPFGRANWFATALQ